MEDKKGQADKSKNSQENEPINLEDFEGPEYDEIKKQYDPLRVFLREKGFEPDEFFSPEYKTVKELLRKDPENPASVTGCQPIHFSNYHDLLRFRQTLSEEERGSFDSYTWRAGDIEWKRIEVLANGDFWENIYNSDHKLHGVKEDFYALKRKVEQEELPDEYMEAIKRGEVRNIKEGVVQIFKQREDLIHSLGEVSDFNEIFKKVRELEALEKDLEQNRDYINHSGNEEWWDILWESALKFEDSEPLERFLKEIEWIRDKGPEYLDRLIADDPNVVKPYFSFEKYPFVGEAILRLAKSQKIEYNREGDEEEDKNKQTEKEEGKGKFWEFRGKNKKEKPKKEKAEDEQKTAQETVGAEVFAQERGAYVRFYNEYKNHYGRKELNKFKEIVFPLRDFIEKGEKNKFVKELESKGVEGLRADLIYDMEAAKMAYDNRKREYIDDQILVIKSELENEKGLEGERLENELKKFRAEKLFGMVTDEMRRLELEKAETYPPKEKNIFFKLLDGYSKFSREHRMARLAIMSVLMTGGFAVFGGGVVGTGLLKTVGLRFGRGLLSMGLSQGVGKLLDKMKIESGENELKGFAKHADLASFEGKFQENLNRIKNAERLKLGIKFFAMTATGLGASAGVGMLEHSLLGGEIGKVDEVPSKKEAAPVGQKPESAPAEPSVKEPIEKPSERPEVKESEAPAEPAKTLSPKEKIPFAPKKLVETLGIEKEAIDQRADVEIPDQQADAKIPDQKADIEIPDQKADTVIDKEVGGDISDQKVDRDVLDQRADGGLTDQKADAVAIDQKAGGIAPDQQADKVAFDQKADGLASQENKNNLEAIDQKADGEKTSALSEDQFTDKEVLDQKAGEIKNQIANSGESPDQEADLDDGNKLLKQQADAEIPDQKADAEIMDQPDDKDIPDQEGDKFLPDVLPAKEINENFGDVSDQQASRADMDSEDFSTSDLTTEDRISDPEIYKEGVKPWLEKTTGITDIEKTGWLNENYLKTHTVRDVLNSDFVNKNFRIDQPYIRGTKEWIEWHDKLAFNEQVEKVLREQVPFWERWGTAKDMKLEEFLVKYANIK